MPLNLQLAIPLPIPPPFLLPGKQALHSESLAELDSMAEGLRPYEKDFGTAVMTVRVVRNRRMEPLLRGVRRKSRRVGKHAFLIIEIDGEYYVNSLASEDKKQGSISDQEWLDLKYDAALSALKYEASNGSAYCHFTIIGTKRRELY